MYAEYTRLQLTFLALHPWDKQTFFSGNRSLENVYDLNSDIISRKILCLEMFTSICNFIQNQIEMFLEQS